MTAAAIPVVTGCLTHRGRRKRGYRFGRRLLRAARLTSREAGAPARWYRCPDCGWYHITSQPGRDL